ncbi:RHS repeat-associated core domain-containing protein [Plantactinospora mayteni]|uniref:RHS repeat domain-containing protein n=1 Tax=Plantactinospora mayteni TaxID=566021 RepID=UPI0031F14D8D
MRTPRTRSGGRAYRLFVVARRAVTYATAAAVVGGLLVAPRSADAAPSGAERAAVAAPVSVPVAPARQAAIPPDPARQAVSQRPVTVTWPAAGSAEVAVPAPGANRRAGAAGPARAGSLPVWLWPAGTAPAATDPPGSASAGSASAGPAANSPPARVRVELLDQAAVRQLGLTGLLLRLRRTDGATTEGAVAAEVDYFGFRAAAGGGFGARLRVVRLPACALAPGCTSPAEVVPGRNDVARSRLRVDVTVPGGAGALFAVVAAPAGSTGSFAATELTPSARWSVGLQSGDFTWSYPLVVPPAPGPVPDLALTYNSGSVDGRMGSSNNQPSWVGEGFDLSAGYIQRSYRECAEDGGNAGTLDQCWVTQNATAVFSGLGGELVRDDATGTWRAQDDKGWRVELKTGAVNGDNDGEYWILTSPQGTRYYFGLSRLPGWSSGRPVTQSTWTVPVFANQAGEPCRQSTPAASWCQQAYRWNLDYVVDAHGDAMSYWYQQETNSYGRWNGSPYFGETTPYVRGGYLTQVDYGQRDGAVYTATPAARVTFGVADRCSATSTSACDPANSANWKNWPDVPWDQRCTSSCTYYWQPTFWTTKRLASISTLVNSGGTLSPAESWTLRHSYPDPYPAGGDPWTEPNDASRSLWLGGITHSGGGVTEPEVTFSGVSKINRHNANAEFPGLYKWRVGAITNETGGRIEVTYSSPQCGAEPYIIPDRNVSRCYPRGDMPAPYAGPDVFYKYVVDRVTERDMVGGNPDQITSYEYLDGAAWRYDDADNTPTADRDWNQWRGYQKIRVRTGPAGAQTLREHLFLRGMTGDRNMDGSTKNVTVTDSQGGTTNDRLYWRGFARETIVYNAAGSAAIEKTLGEPTLVRTTATRARSGLPTLEATYTDERVERKVTTLAAGGTRTTEIRREYDAQGRLTAIDDIADVATTADDACTRITYAENTDAWILDAEARMEIVGVNCQTTPSYPGDLLLDRRNYFDGATVWGTPPTRGAVTRVEEASGHTGGSASYVEVNRYLRDAHGRITAKYDALGNVETTAFTPATGGPATQIVTTNGLGHRSSTVLDPRFGLPLRSTDANDRVTDMEYDGLGRLRRVWAPDRARATWPNEPSVEHGYTIRAGGPSFVTTKALVGDGSRYQTSYQLFDGFLRERQLQAPSPAGGRVITDVRYDGHGRVSRSNAPYWNNQADPGSTLVDVADAAVPGQTRFLYDDADRETAEIFLSGGVEKWRTTTSYGGNWIAEDPPDGSPATMRIFDARERVVELRQYTGGAPTGAYDTTRYAYGRAGELSSVTDAAGNVWRYGYDLRGRRVRAEDPDTGVATSSYDNLDRVTATTDGRGRTLAYTYDALGRRTALHEGSTAGAKLAEWSYDMAGGKGMPASTVRYAGGAAYRSEVLGYDGAGRPTGHAVVIPESETGLAGRYETRLTYHDTGEVATATLPAAGNLPAETLRYGYQPVTGDRTTLTSDLATYVQSASHTELGELSQQRLGAPEKQVVRTFGYETGTRRLATATATTRTATAETPITSVSYTYDPAGNITRIADSVSRDTQCFRTDYLRRLTEAWTPASGACDAAPSTALGGPAPYWHSYGYDRTGNRVREVRHAASGDTTRDYAYPAAGAAQPHTVRSVTTTDSAGSRTDAYAYDSAGNTTNRPGQQLSWDAEGRVAAVTEGSSVTSYLYDADGQRLIRRDASGSTLYLDDTELHSATGGTRYYLLDERPVAVRTGGTLTWLVADHQNTGDIAVAAGTLDVTRRYRLPFGAPRGATPVTWPGERGFVGGVTDAATGLTHLGAREYDPGLGRFLSVDPEVDQFDPQTMQGYAYALNSPVTLSDPDGRKAKPDPYKNCGGTKRACEYYEEQYVKYKKKLAELEKKRKELQEAAKRIREQAEKARQKDKPALGKLLDWLAKQIDEITSSPVWRVVKMGAALCAVAMPGCAAVAVAMSAVDAVVKLSKGDLVGAGLEIVSTLAGSIGLAAKGLGNVARVASGGLKNLSKKAPSWPFVWRVTKKAPHELAKKLDRFADRMDRLADRMNGVGWAAETGGQGWDLWKKAVEEQKKAEERRKKA